MAGWYWKAKGIEALEGHQGKTADASRIGCGPSFFPHSLRPLALHPFTDR